MTDDTRWQECAKAVLPILYKLAWGMLRNEADAQDAVQTALLKGWEKRRRIRSDDACRPYLIRILLNECNNILRHRCRVCPVAEFSATPAPRDGVIRDVAQAIGTLPERLRVPVWLKYMEDLSEKEAAQSLGISVSAFRSRLHRARRALREILDGEVIWE